VIPNPVRYLVFGYVELFGKCLSLVYGYVVAALAVVGVAECFSQLDRLSVRGGVVGSPIPPLGDLLCSEARGFDQAVDVFLCPSLVRIVGGLEHGALDVGEPLSSLRGEHEDGAGGKVR